MGTGQPTQLRIDCATGEVAEEVLTAEQQAVLRMLQEQRHAERAEQQRREAALARLHEQAYGSRMLRDLLTVLGLEE